jgi:hypothetical protein
MTFLQSIGMISPTQLAYAAGLVVLFAMHGRGFISYLLLAHFVALLLIAGAMDMGWLVREPWNDHATAWMLVVYCLSFVALVVTPGFSQVLAVFSFLAIPFFALTLCWALPINSTSAIVNVLSLLQLGVAIIGLGDDSGGDRGRRRAADPVEESPRDYGLAATNSGARVPLVSGNSEVVRNGR